MNLIDKIYNKLGYMMIGSNNPLLILIAIFLIEKNHIYMNKTFIKYFEILKLLKNKQKVSITGTGVLLIFKENEIIKLPLGKHSFNSFNKEYKNYLLLKKSKLSKLVEYNLEKKENYFSMERLFSAERIIQSYRSIYLDLLNFELYNFDTDALLNNEIFNNALAYIFNENGNNFSMDDIQVFLNSKKYLNSCAMHGDLTQYNIMQNINGNVVIIDLDRFTFQGIESIDRIHFCIEFYAKRKKEDFFVILKYILNNKKVSDKYFYLLFLYFIYRIGVEYNDDIKLPISYRENTLKTVELFLEKYKESK